MIRFNNLYEICRKNECEQSARNGHHLLCRFCFVVVDLISSMPLLLSSLPKAIRAIENVEIPIAMYAQTVTWNPTRPKIDDCKPGVIQNHHDISENRETLVIRAH